MDAVLALHEVRVGGGGVGQRFRLPNARTCSNIGDDVETASCGARSKTHSPLISSRLMQRRACPAPTVGVGHARLFATTRINFSLGGQAWFSSHFCGPKACPTSSAEFLDIRRSVAMY